MWGTRGTNRLSDDGRQRGLQAFRRPWVYPYAVLTLVVFLLLIGDANWQARVFLVVLWAVPTLPVVLFARAWTGTRFVGYALLVAGRHGGTVHRADVTAVRLGPRPGTRFGAVRVLVDRADGPVLVAPGYFGRWRCSALRRDIVAWQLGTGPRDRAVDERIRHRVLRPASAMKAAAFAALLAALAVALVTDGRDEPGSLPAAVALTVVAVALRQLVVRPRLVLEHDRYVVVNPFRRFVVPFTEVLGLREELCLTIDRSDRLPVTVWAVRPGRLLGDGVPAALLPELRAWQLAGHIRRVP